LLRVLRAGQKAGALRRLPEEWTAHLVLCAAEGYQQALQDDPELDADEFAATLVDLFERGLLAP
jgi:hypothetical protein